MADDRTSAVTVVDKYVDGLICTEPLQLLPGQDERRSAIAAVLPGEVELAAEFIDLAWTAAHLPVDCEERRDARAWLQDHSRLYSARLCFEALGKDYDLVRRLLVKRWVVLDATNENKGVGQ